MANCMLTPNQLGNVFRDAFPDAEDIAIEGPGYAMSQDFAWAARARVTRAGHMRVCYLSTHDLAMSMYDLIDELRSGWPNEDQNHHSP